MSWAVLVSFSQQCLVIGLVCHWTIRLVDRHHVGMSLYSSSKHSLIKVKVFLQNTDFKNRIGHFILGIIYNYLEFFVVCIALFCCVLFFVFLLFPGLILHCVYRQIPQEGVLCLSSCPSVAGLTSQHGHAPLSKNQLSDWGWPRAEMGLNFEFRHQSFDTAGNWGIK